MPVKKNAPEKKMESMEVPTVGLNSNLKIEEAAAVVNESSPNEIKGKYLFVLGTLMAVVIVAGVVGVALISLNSPENNTDKIPSPIPTSVAIEVMTKKEFIKNEDIKFEVLNGSGVKGLAAKYGKKLESLGFKIAGLGNTDGKHLGVELNLSDDLVGQKDQILEALEDEIPGVIYKDVVLDSTLSAKLIIGK